jgi:hypothetical protein
MKTWRFGCGALLALAAAGFAAASCGGGSSAGAQFCQQWATEFCQRLYDCTPVDQRGTNFAGGSSQSQCVQGWTATCADPPPSGETFDVNCSGGVHVNTAAESACMSELSTITCDEFTSPTYVSVCNQVCQKGSGTGSGGSSSGTGGGGGMGGSGTGTGGSGTGGSGTGGSGTGGSGGATACGTVEPCGGNPTGTWSLTSECLNLAEASLAVQAEFYCPQAVTTATQSTISGSATFNTTGSYNITQNLTGTITFTLPTACTSGLACADYGLYETLNMLPGNSLQCTGTGPCACVETQTNSGSDSGTYTMSGSTLNVNSTTTGLSGTLAYCVQGTTIHFITVDGTMNTGPGGQATIVKDILGQKQ